MGFWDDMAFHIKNYLSYQTENTVIKEFLINSLQQEKIKKDSSSGDTEAKHPIKRNLPEPYQSE